MTVDGGGASNSRARSRSRFDEYPGLCNDEHERHSAGLIFTEKLTRGPTARTEADHGPHSSKSAMPINALLRTWVTSPSRRTTSTATRYQFKIL